MKDECHMIYKYNSDEINELARLKAENERYEEEFKYMQQK